MRPYTSSGSVTTNNKIDQGFWIDRAPDLPRTDCRSKTLDAANPPNWYVTLFMYSCQPTQSNWTLIRINMDNSVNGYTIGCEASTYKPDGYLLWNKTDGLTAPPPPADYVFPVDDVTWFNCNLGDRWPTTSFARFAIDKRYDMVALSQTWVCDDDAAGAGHA